MPARQHQQDHKPATPPAIEAPTSSSSTSTQFSSAGAIPPASQEGGGMLPNLSASQQAFGGADLAGVHAHTGSSASAGSAAVGAKAYATGTAVHLGGELEGSESEGDEMLGHEAAHVVQQGQGRVKPTPQM